MYTDNVSSGSNQENGVYHFGNMQGNQETYGNTACATKTFLNLFGNIFVSATIFPKVSKHGNIGTKHTVFSIMFLIACQELQVTFKALSTSC